MIFLELPSSYNNSWEFSIFEETDELNFSEKIAQITVFIIDSVHPKIQSLMLIQMSDISTQFNVEALKDIVLLNLKKEIILPLDFESYEKRILGE